MLNFRICTEDLISQNNFGKTKSVLKPSYWQYAWWTSAYARVYNLPFWYFPLKGCRLTHKRKFSQDANINFCSYVEHKVKSRFWSWILGEIFELNFGQRFAADVLLRLWSWILVEIQKLGLVKILKSKFNGQDADVWSICWSRDSDLIKICVKSCDMN